MVREAGNLLTATGDTSGLVLDETIVHASEEDPREANLRAWLTSWLAKQPSYDVKFRPRRPRKHRVDCRACGADMDACSNCAAPLTSSPEKGVDAALVTDLLSLAWQQAYDVAVLVSGDADYVPAVEYVQSQGLKVINVAWATKGHELRQQCWASFDRRPRTTFAVRYRRTPGSRRFARGLDCLMTSKPVTHHKASATDSTSAGEPDKPHLHDAGHRRGLARPDRSCGVTP